jgi:hypothetical protein
MSSKKGLGLLDEIGGVVLFRPSFGYLESAKKRSRLGNGGEAVGKIPRAKTGSRRKGLVEHIGVVESVVFV